MKRLLFCLTLSLTFTTAALAQETSSDIPPARPGVQYGKAIDRSGAISMNELEHKLSNDSVFTGKIQGEVIEVCKKKGCFIRLKRTGDGEPVLVRFRDYGFFMPQDIVGKTVVLEGDAKRKQLSVAQLKHYAEDAGKPAEEIAKITEPKTDINIIADGVIVVN